MFKGLLESIIERTEGSLGALIMGLDGIAVEKVIGEAGNEANLDVAAAEFTSLVRSAQRSGTDTGLGKLRELVVSLDSTIIMMPSTDVSHGRVAASNTISSQVATANSPIAGHIHSLKRGYVRARLAILRPGVKPRRMTQSGLAVHGHL